MYGRMFNYPQKSTSQTLGAYEQKMDIYIGTSRTRQIYIYFTESLMILLWGERVRLAQRILNPYRSKRSNGFVFTAETFLILEGFSK